MEQGGGCALCQLPCAVQVVSRGVLCAGVVVGGPGVASLVELGRGPVVASLVEVVRAQAGFDEPIYLQEPPSQRGCVPAAAMTEMRGVRSTTVVPFTLRLRRTMMW